MIGHHFRKPATYKDPVHLFKIAINNALYRKLEGLYTHGQWAYHIFKSGNEINQSYLSIVTNNFSDYLIIENRSGKYTFDFESIKEDFPYWFNTDVQYNILDQIRMALQKEKETALKKRTGKIIDILQVYFLGQHEAYFLYEIHLDKNQDPAFAMSEGLRIRLGFDKYRFWAEVLFFDDLEFRLIIRIKEQIKETIYKSTIRKRIAISAVWLIDGLLACFDDYKIDNTKLIGRLLSKDWQPKEIKPACVNFYQGVLDDSQITAVQKISNLDISALWGPPGTGKTTTLAYLLFDFYKKKEKTLVCSIANVAVDALLVKLIRTFEKYEKVEKRPFDFRRSGKMLRLGYITNEKIKDKHYLKQKSPTTEQLYYQLDKIKKSLKEEGLTDEKRAVLESDKLDIQQELEREKAKLLWHAQMIFCTASKFTIDKSLQAIEFDNLVIDEASMMSVPYLLALAKNVKKRIIIAGDFRQLGPIAVSSSYFSHQWLKKDLFDFYGIHKKRDEIEHPALAMITNQRRFHDSICQLINGNFYQYSLETRTNENDLKLMGRRPHEDSIVAYHELNKKDGFLTERTREQSRFNPYSAQHIIHKILWPLFENPPLRYPFSIAIITPYRAQVAYIDQLLKKEINDKSFQSRVRIGTIHSFQGSEADLLIFDLVDSSNMKVGRLFWQEVGERLINVAISRATGKLIVVGNIKAIIEGKSSNNLSLRTKSVLKLIQNKRKSFN